MRVTYQIAMAAFRDAMQANARKHGRKPTQADWNHACRVTKPLFGQVQP